MKDQYQSWPQIVSFSYSNLTECSLDLVPSRGSLKINDYQWRMFNDKRTNFSPRVHPHLKDVHSRTLPKDRQSNSTEDLPFERTLPVATRSMPPACRLHGVDRCQHLCQLLWASPHLDTQYEGTSVVGLLRVPVRRSVESKGLPYKFLDDGEGRRGRYRNVGVHAAFEKYTQTSSIDRLGGGLVLLEYRLICARYSPWDKEVNSILMMS